MATAQATPAVATPENYENYGSVDLNLSPEWRRPRRLSLIDQTIVGHENGKADAYLKSDPRAKHQFVWCAPYDSIHIATLTYTGYEPVRDDKWDKNLKLWTWQNDKDDKEKKEPRYCTRFEDRLWARAADLYYEAEGERQATQSDASGVVNADLADMPGSVAARDQNGQALRPMARR